MPANPAYLMALPTKNDPMLGYLTTAFQDHVRLRRRFGYRVNDRMWAFFDRLVNLALPRVRDFRGISPNSFDGRGNYTLGLNEQLVFPEIQYDSIESVRGLEISIGTTAKNDEQGRALLQALGMPFRREG